jgi:putative component of toxin-antitoxin plasmid stabilization module
MRAGASGALVTRVPVNDGITELIVDYPDGRYLCMARNDGLVMSLMRLKRQPK